MESLRLFAPHDSPTRASERAETDPRRGQRSRVRHIDRPTLALKHCGGTIKALNQCFSADLSGARPRRWKSEFLSRGPIMSGKKLFAIVLVFLFIASITILMLNLKQEQEVGRLFGVMMLVIYFVITGLIFLPIPRKMIVLDWYNSQTWLFLGKGPVDILFKQIGSRISIEFFAFTVSVVIGALGGAYFMLLKNDSEEAKA